MKAQFEISLVEKRDLWAFDSGLKSLIIELGGGSFEKSEDMSNNETTYRYECANDNVRLTMNSVGTLAARHRLIEFMHDHSLLTD